MGICTSCYSGVNATTTATVKLILLDGQLKEFTSPVTVSVVAPPSFTDVCSFICNADEMNFDSYVRAMGGEEELRPGRLYFELPAPWLKRRLTAEDMASLAVKAGGALMVDGGEVTCGCWVKRFEPLVYDDGGADDDDGGGDDDDGDGDDVRMMSSRGVGGGGTGGVGNHRGGGGKGRKFTRLERIAEE